MVTTKQIAALKYLVAASKHGNDTAKRVIWFLIDKSNRLSKEVCVTLTQGQEGYSAEEIDEIVRTLHGITSCNGTTHLNEIFKVTGTDFVFDLHYGHFGSDGSFDTSGMFPGAPTHMVLDPKLTILNQPRRYTFWLSKKMYSKSAERIPVTRKEIKAIDLSKPGLYLAFEGQRRTG
jgi:hypothetical protein